MMRHRLCCGALLALLAVSGPAFAQATAPATPPPVGASLSPRPASVKRPAPARKHPANISRVRARPGVSSGAWVKLNTHLLGTMGESTWVNLAQAVTIRFYRAGKTSFAAVGVGGNSSVSTSDPREMQKLRAYVLTHQAK